MSLSLYRSHSPHAIALADGRMLSPGEEAEVDPDETQNAALIADGVLVQVRTTPTRSRRKDTEGGPA